MEDTSFHLSTWVYRQLEGKETLKWLVSHVFIYVGMVILIFGYCVIGAFTFQYLENSAIHEKRLKEGTPKCWKEIQVDATKNRTELVIHLYNITYEKLLSAHVQTNLRKRPDTEVQSKLDEWVLAAKVIIEDYEEFIKVHQKNVRLCEAELAVGDDWQFVTALLFATTVVTTIGYGNRTPKSWRGRLGTLLYAMLGVPLMLFCLRTLGRSIGNGLDYLYSKATEYWIRMRAAKEEEVFSTPTDDAQADGTTGPLQDGNLVLPSIGLPGEPPSGGGTQLSAPGADGSSKEPRDRSRGHEHGEHSSPHKIRIPLAVVFLVTTLYNAIGAALFSHYEKWSFLDGFYFTFITLSTIGFGDLVPRILLEKEPDYGGTPTWWVETSYVLYVMFGLTVIQMSFELTRETINRQFYQLGHSVGVIQDGHKELEERDPGEPDGGDERRRRKRRHDHRQDDRGLLRPPLIGQRGLLDDEARSPSMRSAELGSGQTSTAPSSAESVPRPARPKSARPRRPEHHAPND